MAMSIRNINNRRLKKVVTECCNSAVGTFRVGKYSTLGISAEKTVSGYHFNFGVEGDTASDYGEAVISSRDEVRDDEFVWVSDTGEKYHVPTDVIRYFMDVADTL